MYLAHGLLYVSVSYYYYLPSVTGKFPSTAERKGLNGLKHIYFFLHIFTISSLITLSLSSPQETCPYLAKLLSPLTRERRGTFFAISGKNSHLTLDLCPIFLSTPLVTLLEDVRVSSETQLYLMASYPDKKS